MWLAGGGVWGAVVISSDESMTTFMRPWGLDAGGVMKCGAISQPASRTALTAVVVRVRRVHRLPVRNQRATSMM